MEQIAQDTQKLKTTKLFEHINSLGNAAEENWFLNLSNNEIYTFLHKLKDIWDYRAQITKQMKCSIYPPNGKPFHDLEFRINKTYKMKQYALKIIRRLVTSSLLNDDKNLASLYVLGSLTLVSSHAEKGLPWLYEDFK